MRRIAGRDAERLELDADAAAALARHAWPRNIRELERCLETAVALADGSAIAARHLRLAETPPRPPVHDPRRAELVVLLERYRGNVSAVAQAMGKKRQQIQRWLRDYGIDPAAYR